MKTISEILSFLNIPIHNSDLDHITIIDLSQSSTEMLSDWAFLALKGSTYNGVDYIDNAIINGATLILVDQADQCKELYRGIPIFYIPQLKTKMGAFVPWFYDNISKYKTLVGVTGTNGKSSICHLFAQISYELSKKIFVMGTLGYGIWPTLKSSERTTNDTVTIQRELYKNKENYDIAILEISSHALVQDRVSDLNVKIAVWSNLSHDHLDYHQNMEAYYQAKKKLFIKNSITTAIINMDDKYGLRLYSELITDKPNIKILTYSSLYLSSVIISGANLSLNGLRATITYNNCSHQIQCPLLGNFNSSNIAAISTLCFELKYDFFWKKFNNLQSVSGRMQLLKLSETSPKVIIDYSHTPDALQKALESIKILNVGKIWCVFGCGGNRDKSKRALMGQVAQEYSDQIILTEDNPRDEDSKLIIKDIIGNFDSSQFKILYSRKEAIEYALCHANTIDVILIAGKGHEQYQESRGIKQYFSDVEVVKNYENWSSIR